MTLKRNDKLLYKVFDEYYEVGYFIRDGNNEDTYKILAENDEIKFVNKTSVVTMDDISREIEFELDDKYTGRNGEATIQINNNIIDITHISDKDYNARFSFDLKLNDNNIGKFQELLRLMKLAISLNDDNSN